MFRLFPFAHTDFFPIVTVQVSKSRLQLVACASILIASKYEEVMTRSVGEFIYVSDNAYTKEELCKVRSVIVLLACRPIAQVFVVTADGAAYMPKTGFRIDIPNAAVVSHPPLTRTTNTLRDTSCCGC